MTTSPGQRMADVITALENGDPVSSVDLQWFANKAEEAVALFCVTPSYQLFATDLSIKASAARAFLRGRDHWMRSAR